MHTANIHKLINQTHLCCSFALPSDSTLLCVNSETRTKADQQQYTEYVYLYIFRLHFKPARDFQRKPA